MKKFDRIRVVEYAEEIKELFEKWADPDSKDFFFVENCEMTPVSKAVLEESNIKSSNITLWIATEYFHELERVCDNVAHCQSVASPMKKKKTILFDKFEIEEAEMKKLKIPSYVATFEQKAALIQHGATVGRG